MTERDVQNCDRSLDDLEGSWAPLPADATSLIRRCYDLHKIPLSEYSSEHLRLALRQRIGLGWTIPLALNALEQEPWLEGDCYPGDVLVAAVGLPDDCLSPSQETRLSAVVSTALANPSPELFVSEVIADLEQYRDRHSTR